MYIHSSQRGFPEPDHPGGFGSILEALSDARALYIYLHNLPIICVPLQTSRSNAVGSSVQRRLIKYGLPKYLLEAQGASRIYIKTSS